MHHNEGEGDRHQHRIEQQSAGSSQQITASNQQSAVIGLKAAVAGSKLALVCRTIGYELSSAVSLIQKQELRSLFLWQILRSVY